MEPEAEPSIRRQCELLEISRTAYYYLPCPETEENLELMRRLDKLHVDHPVYGSRRLTVLLRRQGCEVNRKRVVRLLRRMGIEAIYPRRSLSQPGEGHEIFPYLLKGLEINGPNQVWCSDITYIPMQYGFMYLVAVMDWWSRYVLAWELSNTLEADFCIRASADPRSTGSGGFQHRSRFPIHQSWIHRRGRIGRCGSEHGWSGPMDGQSIYRTIVVEHEVRRR